MEGIEIFINNVVSYLQSIGLIGGVLLVLLESIFPVLPLGLFIGFNILAFGHILGFIISYISTIIGCMLSFFLFRYIIKHSHLKVFKDDTKKRIENIMNKVQKVRFNKLVVILAMPFTPAFAINIAAGLSKIDVKKYFLALLISKLSIVFFWGYIGVSFIESIRNPIELLKIAGIVFVTYIISKFVEKIVKLEE